MIRLNATEIRKMGVKCNKNDLGHMGFSLYRFDRHYYYACQKVIAFKKKQLPCDFCIRKDRFNNPKDTIHKCYNFNIIQYELDKPIEDLPRSKIFDLIAMFIVKKNISLRAACSPELFCICEECLI